MRLVWTAGSVAVASLALSVTAGAGHRSSASFVDCGATQMVFLFWPQGHQVVPGVKFGAYPIPHTEIYRPDPTYSNTNFLAFFDSQGQVSVAPACTEKTPAGTPTAAVPSATTVTATASISCTFPQAAQFEIVGTPKVSSSLRVVSPIQTTRTIKTKVRVKGKVKGKPKFKLVTKHVTTTTLTTVLTEQVAASSTLTYDAAFCTAGTPPTF
jgi:hypothetical protein